MKKNKIKILSIILSTLLMISIGFNVYAHSGRTDSSGGHKDNKNKSGLGSYHYHCGGNPPHLHDNGNCPYSSSSAKSSSSSSSATSSSSSGSSTKSKPTTIDATEIQINENIESMEVGKNKTLTVTITPSNVTDKNITWKSSDESIAIVNLNGEVIAKKSGIVDIIATTTNNKTSTIKISVREEAKVEETKIEKTKLENTNITKTSTKTENNIINNTTSSKENPDILVGAITLGVLGTGGYLGYRKYKNYKEDEKN